jgi:hypothetical protein
VEDGLPDVVDHVLETLRLGLPTRVHHPSDCVDGGGEGVELLLEPYDPEVDVSTKLVDQLKNTARMDLLTIAELESANCSLVWVKDPSVLVNTASRALSCLWRRWDLLHSSK